MKTPCRDPAIAVITQAHKGQQSMLRNEMFGQRKSVSRSLVGQLESTGEGTQLVHSSYRGDEYQDRLRVLCQRLELAIKASGVGVWEFNAKTGELFWDDRMRSLFGIPDDVNEIGYDDFRAAIHPDDLAKVDRVIARSLKTQGNLLGQFRIVTPAKSIKHVRAYGISHTQDDGSEILVGANWDVSRDVVLQEELRASEERTRKQFVALEAAKRELEHLAFHDLLTELPNRRFMEHFFEGIQKTGIPVGGQVVCLHIDLDHFKEVNDTYGHSAGDAVLKSVGATLATLASAASFVGRIGGDEFVVFLTGPGAKRSSKHLAHRIVESLDRPMKIGEHTIRIGASIGSSSQSSGPVTSKLMADADAALYEAKRQGRGRVSILTPARIQEIEHARSLADEFLQGLEDDQFLPFFQPQVDSSTFEITGVEALVRWNHPSRGLLTPDVFLPTAEKLGKMGDLDDLVLRKSLDAFRSWRQQGLKINRIAVNVSAQRLRDRRFVERMRKLEFTPGSLSFELLESISFDGEDSSLADQIENIKSLGIDVEIDDFGTGHASIISLLELAPARLKIDRKLIAPLKSSGPQYRLVSAMIDIGRTLGIGIVAEGVETMEQAVILRTLGCQTLQGYFFSRPISGYEIFELLRGPNLARSDGMIVAPSPNQNVQLHINS